MECVDGIRLVLPADKISRIFNNQMSTTKANLNNIFHRGQALAFTVVNEKSGFFGYFSAGIYYFRK